MPNAALQLRRAQAFNLRSKKLIEEHAIEASAASACSARRSGNRASFDYAHALALAQPQNDFVMVVTNEIILTHRI